MSEEMLQHNFMPTQPNQNSEPGNSQVGETQVPENQASDIEEVDTKSMTPEQLAIYTEHKALIHQTINTINEIEAKEPKEIEDYVKIKELYERLDKIFTGRYESPEALAAKREWEKYEQIDSLDLKIGFVRSLKILSDGRIAAGVGHNLLILDLESKEITTSIGFNIDEQVRSVTQLEDGKLVCGLANGNIEVREEGFPKGKYPIHDGIVKSVAELTSGELASISKGPSNTLRVWNPETGIMITKFKNDSEINAMVKLEDDTLALACADGKIKIWDPLTDNLKTYFAHKDEARALVGLKNGNIASASKDETIKIMDPETDKYVRIIPTQDSRVRSIIELSDGNLATTSDDGHIRIWNVQTGELINELRNENGWRENTLIELPNGSLVSGSDDGKIRIWGIPKDKQS